MREIQRPPSPPNDQLLRTKLTAPQGHGSLIAREALWARLDAGLSGKMTWVSAPAGSGKTTLISQWIAARREPAAWVSLEAGDSDPVRFWRYLAAACETFDPAISREIRPLLDPVQRDPWEAVAAALSNRLAQSSARRILVLDDYHTVTSPAVHASLTYLIDHLPPGLHLVLITRHDPPLPLARLRARNELNELRGDDLRFSRAEIRAFFEQDADRPLPEDTLDRLESRTEGWCAGLRLIALALQRRAPQEVEPFLQMLRGTHRPILDYLVTDVLLAQPEEIQTFLLQTSFLPRLTPSLCDAVTETERSAELLQALEAANIFLAALGSDGRRPWYRYHPLFAEAMQAYAQRQWDESGWSSLLLRASTWYEQQGSLEEAIDAALDAQAFPRAAALIDSLIGEAFPSELVTLRGWLERLPESVLADHPEAAFAYATAILLTPERHRPDIIAQVERPLRLAEQRWEQAGQDPQRGHAAALRALVCFWQGDRPAAFALAAEGLRLMPESDSSMWRGAALILSGSQALEAGRLDAAQRTILEARALCEANLNPDGVRAAMMIHGDLCYEQGQLHQSYHLYQQVLAQVQGDSQYGSVSDRGYVDCGLAAVELEWNDLGAAYAHASEAVAIAQEIADQALQVRACVLLARIQQAQGASDRAQALLDSLIPSLRLPELFWYAQAWQARLALAAGNLPLVQLWHARWSWRRGVTLFPALIYHEQQLAARLLLAEGQADAALDLLEPMAEQARAVGWVGVELNTLILAAWAYHLRGDPDSLHGAVRRALALAQPENIRQPFLDKGEPLAAVLQAALPDLEDKALLAFARTLLAQLGTRRAEHNAAPLADPLSAQEQRVLRLLVAGLSNAEIAQELVVSPNTIKSQLKSIYRKLNVNSREAARDAVHDFHLL